MKCAAIALLLASMGAPAFAWAQGSAPSESQLRSAQEAHRHALQLFDRGQHAEALAEFERAYATAPSFRILYNIGLCHAALGDAPTAVDAFSNYLSQGGDKLPPARRVQVEAEIARLSKQQGLLELAVDESGAEVSLDGKLLGRGPIARQVRLGVGRHTVTVRSADGTLKTQSVTLTPGSQQQLHFQAPSESARSSVAAAPSEPRPRVDPTRREVPWLAWGVTGALGAATVITGALALGAHGDERDAQLRQGVTRDELDGARSKVERLALTTDILLASTLLASGTSLYLTLRPAAPKEGQTALQVSPGFISLRRTF
jgi:tetratricopeptide (TPR) repeat protein